jgi:Kef-type K+ transport system membrane component KefB
MSHHDLIVLFLQICAMLGVALVFGQGMRRLRFPGVLGELGGGIVLGPTIFGALAPAAYAWLFVTGDLVSSGREAVIKIGMLFFLFAGGLEVNLSHLRQRGLSVALC